MNLQLPLCLEYKYLPNTKEWFGVFYTKGMSPVLCFYRNFLHDIVILYTDKLNMDLVSRSDMVYF